MVESAYWKVGEGSWRGRRVPNMCSFSKIDPPFCGEEKKRKEYATPSITTRIEIQLSGLLCGSSVSSVEVLEDPGSSDVICNPVCESV
jgi:hypothetical protein